MTGTAEHLSKTATDTLCKKGQQMKRMEIRFFENCRTYVHDKPVNSLSIAVALGRQDAGRDKVAGFMTAKLMRPQRPQTPVGKSEPQAKTLTLLEEALNLLTLAQNVSSGLVLGPDDARRQTGTRSRIRSASLASNGGAAHYWRASSADARW
jgi:hypothetical protein